MPSTAKLLNIYLNEICVLFLIFLFCAINPVYAENAISKVEQKIIDNIIDNGNEKSANFLSNILPEDSNVEVSFNAIENSKNKYKLSGDLSFVAPLMLNDNGVLFNQTQIGIYNVRDNDRVALNMGFGYRQLSDDENYFTGINSFFDLDSKGNTRASAGLEFQASLFSANANIYRRIGKSSNSVGVYKEKVLNGHDISVSGPLPYLPWLDITLTNYRWDAVKAAKDSTGTKFSTEIRLDKNTVFGFGFDNNNIDKTTTFASIMFTSGGGRQPTLKDGLFSETAFNLGDVREKLLMKVRRNNRIVLESENVGVVVVRLD